ncbi:MAG: peptide ABC transporter permease [Actinomycetota bacterium]|nr:MAG: peptide ABC transporter permease [Actinomycetota bacterium]
MTVTAGSGWGLTLPLGELRRGKLRFGLLTAAVGLLVFLVLFQQTLASALLGYFTGALEHQSGAVLVYGEDARRNVEGSIVPPSAVEQVAAVRGVARAAPIGEGTFTVRTEAGLRDAVLFGFEPGGPGTPTTLSAGRLPRAEGEAVASAVDAEDGFGLGRRVVVVPGGTVFTIVGLAEDIRFSVLPTLFVPYGGYVRAALASNPDARGVLPSLVAVEPEPGQAPEVLAARITRSVEGVEALDRETAVASLPGVAQVRTSFGIVLGLGFIVVALVVGFFFLIITVQKADALALLRAVGSDAWFLVRGLALQVILVVGLGVALAGILLFGVAAASDASFPISADPGLLAGTGGAVLALALVASLASVRRILRIDPMSATSRSGAGGLA